MIHGTTLAGKARESRQRACVPGDWEGTCRLTFPAISGSWSCMVCRADSDSSHRLHGIFTRHILEPWHIYSSERVLLFHQLAGLKEHFHTFFTHQVVSYTERMAEDASPSKVRFSSTPYKDVFLRQLQKSVLSSKRVEIQYAVEELFFYCLENIYQHAGTKGYAMLNVTDKDIEFAFFDKGPGIADIDDDNIPDILEAIKPRVSLINRGSKGMGLTKSIRLADAFHLYSNGYVWDKADPEALHKTAFYVKGVCIVAIVTVTTAVRRPRRYAMI